MRAGPGAGRRFGEQGPVAVLGEEPRWGSRVVAGNDIPLEPGMAFSVEPGIYLAGRCGARIEDIVVCTEDGVRTLNDGPRELVELPG